MTTTSSTGDLTCIFCATVLDPTVKRQHIIQESIGGTLATRTTTCTACNDYFARGIDTVVAAHFAHEMNVLGPALQAGGPEVHMELKGSREPITFGPGQIPHTPGRVDRLPGGKASVRGQDISHAKKLLKSTGNTFGPTTKVIYDTIPASGTALATRTLIDPDELRSALKIAIEYLCHRMPTTRAQFEIADAVDIVRNAKNSETIIPIILPTHPLPALLAVGFVAIPFSHRIWISCDKATGIQCLIDLFSTVAYRFRLGGYSGEPRTLLYQKNILKNAPTDLVIELQKATELPAIPAMPTDVRAYLERESKRIQKLHLDALWFVDTSCRDMLLDLFKQGLQTGKSPGDRMTVTTAQLLTLMGPRLGVVFQESLKNHDAAAESRKVIASLDSMKVFENEDVDAFSAPLLDHIWQLHLELYTLHKKHVGQPDYGFENYGIFKEDPKT